MCYNGFAIGRRPAVFTLGWVELSKEAEALAEAKQPVTI